jgi:VWFA-related protein
MAGTRVPAYVRLAVVFAVSASLFAQDQKPVFRAKIDAVTLDVTVLDKHGKPVTDLTAADFEITEQGKKQTIETLELIDMDKRPPMSSNLYHEVRTMASLEQEVARRESRLIVIFLDDYHIKRIDQYQVQLQVADVVKAMDPRDLVAIMYPLTSVTALSFSRDHEESAREIARFQGRQGDYFPAKGPIEEEHVRNLPQIENRRRNVVKTAIEGLCTFLGTLRDTRKQVLYVSTWAPGGMTGFALDDFQRIQRAAARSNTAIYTYDPRGLVAGGNIRTHEWMRVLADQTGGRAIVNRNNAREAMQAMVTDSSAYYLVGYTSTENVHDGKFHDVKVKVKRKDVEVRARKGYWAYDAEALERAAAPLPPPVDPAINAALAAAEAPEGRVFHVWAGVDRDPAGSARVTVVWEAASAPDALSIGGIDRAEVTVASGGAPVIHSAPALAGAPRLSGSVSFPAEAGALDVRIAAQDRAGATVDSAQLKLTVPDPAAPGFSTPQLFRGRSARELSGAGALPTAVREFRRDEIVMLRVRPLGLGAAPAVSARLMNERGEVLHTFEVKHADPGTWEIAIPPASFGLGRYVVEITGADGGLSARTLAAFRVK